MFEHIPNQWIASTKWFPFSERPNARAKSRKMNVITGFYSGSTYCTVHPVLLIHMLYFSDRWNILDFITLLIYSVTFLLRIVTWALSESVTDNRALVISGYLYGLNTMFLTLRAFGHVMETVKKVGAIQIALFHIIGDVVTIFWQFVATILAFSIAITKVYMAERSFISSNSGQES